MVGQLAQFLGNPGCIHWEAVKQVVRYLKGMMDLKLTYGGDEQRGIEGYADADGATTVRPEGLFFTTPMVVKLQFQWKRLFSGTVVFTTFFSVK